MRAAVQYKGQWKTILIALGADPKKLTNKHQPCPFCGGTDRYRFDDKRGTGDFYCNGCGAGDGMDFVQRLFNCDFKQALEKVRQVTDPVKSHRSYDPEMSIQRVLQGAYQVTSDCEVASYLKHRGLSSCPKSILYHRACYESETKQKIGAMIARIQGASGKVLSLHRTYLLQGRKAPVGSPKKVMTPISELRGSAIRLYPAGEELCIAEGIEDGIAVHELSGLPVWCGISAGLMAQMKIPETVERVYIAGNNDSNYAGQKAAYTLAHRLSKEHEVVVRIPERNDWLDELNARRKKAG